MGAIVEYGIKISVDGKTAVPEIERIDAAAKKMTGQLEQAGRAMATEFTAGTAAVTKSADAVSAMAETEAVATERIKAMVAASLQQAAHLDASALAADRSAASTRRVADETVNYLSAQERSASLARVTAQMHQPQAPAHAAAISTEESLKYVAALQRQADLLGKNAAEAAQYEVKMLGGTRALQAQVGALVSNAEALRAQIAGEERAGRAADNFIAKLKEQVTTLGMSRTQLLAHQAAQLGVSHEAAPLIAKLNEAAAAAKGHGASVNGATQATHQLGFATAQSKRELIVLAHELSQGRYSNFGSSLMVLAEQTGVASLFFSKAGLAAIGLTGAVVGVGYAMIKGASEQKHMNDALILTGNYAGLTSDSLNALAHASVVAGGSIGEAKKSATELAASGKFTGAQIGYITESVVALEHATGKSIKQTIKEFESLAVQTTGNTARATEAISKATIKLDDTYHFLTEAVYEQIRALEKEGDVKGAAALATETYAHVTKERAEEIIGNLGNVARAWYDIKSAIGQAVDAIGEWGKKSTPATDVKKYSFMLQQFDEGLAGSNQRLGRKPDDMSPELAASRTRIVLQLTDAVDKLNKADAAGIAQGAATLAQSKAVHAASRITADDVRLQRKGMSELNVALAQYADDVEIIRAGNPSSALISEDAIARHKAAIVKAHSAKEAKPHVDQVDGTRMADYIKRIEAETAAEKQHYDDLAKLDELYHQAGRLSDQAYFANKRRYSDKIAASAIEGYDKEVAALVAHDNLTEAEEARTQEKINAIWDKRAAAKARNAAESFYLDEKERLRQDAIVAASDDAMNKYISSLQKEADALDAANVGHEESKAAVEREIIGRLDLAIAYQKQFVEQQAVDGASAAELAQAPRVLEYLQQQRDLRERMARGLDQQEVDKANKKAADAASRAWDTTAGNIKSTLADAIANGGASAWKKLRAAIVSQGMQVPLQYVGNMGASLLYPAAAQAGTTGGAGGASGVIGAAQAASNVYKAITGGFESIGASVTGYVQSAINSVNGVNYAMPEAANGATATMAGTAASYAAGMAAGKLVGGAVSGQYGIGDHGSAVVNVSTVIGAVLGGPIGGAIGGAVGGLLNRAFGMGSTEVRSQGLRGTLADSGATGQSYKNNHKDGGWFRSDKNWTDTAALGSDVINTLTSGFTSLKSVSAGFAKSLDVDSAAIAGYSKQFDIALTNDATKNQAAITAFFTTLGDELATRLIPNIADFAKSGETASVTLQRLSGDFQATNTLAGLLGKTAVEVFGSLGVASTAARERLIDLSGGVAALNTQTAFFAANYLSAAERIAPVTKAVDAAMADLGLSSVRTREQFKATVLRLDLATEAGARQYAAMMQLADAFAQVHAATDDLSRSEQQIADERKGLQQQLDEVSISAAQLRLKNRTALDESNRALYDQLNARKDLAAAYATESETLKNTADRMRTFQDSTLSFKNSLLLGSLSTLTPGQATVEAKRQYEETLAKAKTGDASAQSALQAAATAFLTADQRSKASTDAYAADAAKVQSDLAALAEIAGSQASDAQLQLAALDRQVSGLITLNETALGIKQALANMGMVAGSGALDGSHAAGLTRVPFDGYRAELHEDEVVVDAPAAAAMRRYFGRAPSQGGGGNTDALTAEIKRLNERIAQLEEAVERNGDKVASATFAAADRVADKVNAGAKEAAKVPVYAEKMKGVLA